MQSPGRATLAMLALTLAVAPGAAGQNAPLQVKEEKPGLLKLAKVAPADAIRTAQARFPMATITSGELEKEAGKLIYTFDLQQPGVKGTEEVNIDAMTGAIVATEHEAPVPPKPAAPRPAPKKPAP